MLLKYIQCIHEKENETDYDTAVDLTHYNFEKTEYLFQTSNDTKITISSSYESSTKSYLEPDFEEKNLQLPIKNHHNSGYEYKEFKDPYGNSSNNNYHIEVELPIEKKALTIEEFKIYLENKEIFVNSNQYNLSYEPLEKLIKKYDETTILSIIKYQDSLENFEPNIVYPKCSKDDVEKVIVSISQYILKKEQFFEIEFQKDLNEQIQFFDLQSKNILESNKIIDSKNLVNQQKAQEMINSLISYENDLTKDKIDVSYLEINVSEKETSKESLGTKVINSVKKVFKR